MCNWLKCSVNSLILVSAHQQKMTGIPIKNTWKIWIQGKIWNVQYHTTTELKNNGCKGWK